MRKKQYITLFLLFISMVMLGVPVLPHHHHADGLLCMKNDITTDCCEHRHAPNNEHCCCDTGCVTTHFVQQSPTSDNNSWAHPDLIWITPLYGELLLKLLVAPKCNSRKPDNLYLESLHSTFITRATGLRAPPCVLA